MLPKKIHDLLYKAGHPGTPDKEASICAIKAAKLYHEYSNKQRVETPIEDVAPSNMWHDEVIQANEPNAKWEDINLFNVRVSPNVSKCQSCGKAINKGEIIASVRDKGDTHHRCRRYWINMGYKQ